jgi:hypothetical protein
MIIKFKSDDSWVFFGEIDHLEHSPINGEQCVVGVESPIICYGSSTDSKQKAALEQHELSFFTKNMTDATVIHAYSPIYLMNDNGKTIEII